MLQLSDPQGALRTVELLSGAGSALGALEFLTLRREFTPSGFYSAWKVSAASITSLFVIRLVLALWFAFVPLTGAVGTLRIAALVAVTLTLVRMMPLGIEAADQMISILLAVQLLASLAPGNERVQNACLLFIAAQSALSYSIAGWAKLLKSTWRDGSYLQALVRTEIFGHALAARVVSSRAIASYLSLGLIALECLFPLALILGTTGATIACAMVLLMHLANAYLLGLNLFVWAFAATYPAVIYTASLIWSYHTNR